MSKIRVENLLNFTSRRRVPLILQTEVAECGLACLAMVAGFHGYETDLGTLRRKLSISSHGMTLRSLIDIAGYLGLASRPLRLEVDQLDQLSLPCILHWDMSHFVVLKKVDKDKITILDPSRGERQLSFEEVSKHFSGVALEVIPTDEFVPSVEKQKIKISHFWSKIVGFKRSIINILLFSLLLQVFAVVSPLYMQTVVDDVILRNDFNLLMLLALGFGLLMLIEVGTRAVREFVILTVSNKLNIQMSANLFRHLIRLSMDYFSKRHLGDILSRFRSMDNVRALLTTGFVSTVVDGIMAIITLIAMLIYSVKLTFIVIVIVVIYALFRYALFYPVRRLTEEKLAANAKKDSHFMESMRAIQTVKVFQKENDRQSQWQNRLAEAMNKNIGIEKWNIGFGVVNQLLFGLENIIIVYFAASGVIEGTMTLGMLYAFMSYKSRFIGSMNTFIEQLLEIRMLGVHLERIADIALAPAEKQHVATLQESRLDSRDNRQITGQIEIKNLAYRYNPLDPFVFSNVSMSIKPGEVVALVGPSGTGKTTLLKCMMGLLEATEGEILVDGREIDKIENFRGSIAGVMQDDQLISGSITENIAFFEPQVDINKVYLCAQLANIHEEIARMPMQYETLVGDMGASLSGGQKQRIILARALYREPRILFLDEATSHLDAENELRINEAIKSFNITRVVVAHRKETIASCDRVITINSN